MPSTFFAPSFIAFCLASSISSSCPTSAWKSKYISLSRTNTCCVYLNVYPEGAKIGFVSGENLPRLGPRLNSCLISSIPMSHQRQMNKSMTYGFLYLLHFREKKRSKTHNLSKRLKIVTFVTKTYHAISTHHKRNNLVSLFLQPKQDTRCIKAATVG